MRVLVGTSGGTGHVGPVVPVVAALAELGHEVTAIAPATALDRLALPGVELVVAPEPAAEQVDVVWARARNASPADAAVHINRELFGRLNTSTRLSLVEATVDRRSPGLVLHEAAEFAPAVVAHRRGIRHVQVGIGLAQVEAGSLAIAEPALEDIAAGVVAAIRSSTYLTHLPASMDSSPYPDTRRFRRTRRSIDAGGSAMPGSPRPLVYASLGTIVGREPAGQAALQAIVDALREMPVRALISLGGGSWRPTGPIPSHIRVERWVDPNAAMSEAALVVCHGGAGTTFEALAAGVPVIAVPFMADQPTNARRVHAAGAGVVLPPTECTPTGLVAAVRAVFGDQEFRDAAKRIRDEMATMRDLSQVLVELIDGAG